MPLHARRARGHPVTVSVPGSVKFACNHRSGEFPAGVTPPSGGAHGVKVRARPHWHNPVRLALRGWPRSRRTTTTAGALGWLGALEYPAFACGSSSLITRVREHYHTSLTDMVRASWSVRR